MKAATIGLVFCVSLLTLSQCKPLGSISSVFEAAIMAIFETKSNVSFSCFYPHSYLQLPRLCHPGQSNEESSYYHSLIPQLEWVNDSGPVEIIVKKWSEETEPAFKVFTYTPNASENKKYKTGYLLTRLWNKNDLNPGPPPSAKADGATVSSQTSQSTCDRPDPNFDDLGASNYDKEIKQAFRCRLIDGHSDTKFAPGDHLTRQEMAALIAGKTYPAILGPISATESSGVFKDVGEHNTEMNPIYIDNIHALHAAGIVAGDTDGNFNPTAKTKRAHFIAALTRIMEKAGRNPDASDVSLPWNDLPGKWYHDDIAKLYHEQVILDGDQTGSRFQADDPIRRDYATVLALRLCQQLGKCQK